MRDFLLFYLLSIRLLPFRPERLFLHCSLPLIKIKVYPRFSGHFRELFRRLPLLRNKNGLSEKNLQNPGGSSPLPGVYNASPFRGSCARVSIAGHRHFRRSQDTASRMCGGAGEGVASVFRYIVGDPGKYSLQPLRLSRRRPLFEKNKARPFRAALPHIAGASFVSAYRTVQLAACPPCR